MCGGAAAAQSRRPQAAHHRGEIATCGRTSAASGFDTSLTTAAVLRAEACLRDVGLRHHAAAGAAVVDHGNAADLVLLHGVAALVDVGRRG